MLYTWCLAFNQILEDGKSKTGQKQNQSHFMSRDKATSLKDPQMLKLSYRDLKITVINMLKDIMEKVDNMCEKREFEEIENIKWTRQK